MRERGGKGGSEGKGRERGKGGELEGELKQTA